MRVVNKQTGEIKEYKYESLEQFADAYEQITAEIQTLERAKKKMAEHLKEFMDGEDKLEVSKGRYFRRVVSRYKNYDLKLVQGMIPDWEDLVMPDKKKIDELLVDHQDDDKWEGIGRYLRDNMIVDRATESIRLIKE